MQLDMPRDRRRYASRERRVTSPEQRHSAGAMSLQGFSGAAGIKYGLNLRGVKKPVAPGRGLFCAAQEDDDEGDAEEDRA